MNGCKQQYLGEDYMLSSIHKNSPKICEYKIQGQLLMLVDNSRFMLQVLLIAISEVWSFHSMASFQPYFSTRVQIWKKRTVEYHEPQ